MTLDIHINNDTTVTKPFLTRQYLYNDTAPPGHILEETLNANNDPGSLFISRFVHHVDGRKIRYYVLNPNTVCKVFPRGFDPLQGAFKTLRKAVVFVRDSEGRFAEYDNFVAIKPLTERLADKKIIQTKLKPEDMAKQIGILQRLQNSRGIASILGTFTYQSTTHAQIKSVLIMPRYEKRDLSSHLLSSRQNKTVLFGDQIVDKRERDRCIHTILLDLFHGLKTIHAHGLIHRDIKPENILLDAHWRAGIIDFDVSVHVDDTLLGIAGTQKYLAPEYSTLHKEIRYNPLLEQSEKNRRRKEATTPAIDMWAIGVTLSQMFLEDPEHNLPRDLSCITDGINLRSPFLQERPANLSFYGNLVWDLLRIDPKQRPTAAAVIERLEAATFDLDK